VGCSPVRGPGMDERHIGCLTRPRVLCDFRAGNCNVTRNEQGPLPPAEAASSLRCHRRG
jgi:hypothetical protein